MAGSGGPPTGTAPTVRSGDGKPCRMCLDSNQGPLPTSLPRNADRPDGNRATSHLIASLRVGETGGYIGLDEFIGAVWMSA